MRRRTTLRNAGTGNGQFQVYRVDPEQTLKHVVKRRDASRRRPSPRQGEGEPVQGCYPEWSVALPRARSYRTRTNFCREWQPGRYIVPS